MHTLCLIKTLFSKPRSIDPKRGKLPGSSNTIVTIVYTLTLTFTLNLNLTIIVAQFYARWRWQRSAWYVSTAGPYYDFLLEYSGMQLTTEKRI